MPLSQAPACTKSQPSSPFLVPCHFQELTSTGKAEKLKGFEIVKAVHLVATPFSVENDLLTPTFKFKRPQLQKRFQKEIDAMYATLKD